MILNNKERVDKHLLTLDVDGKYNMFFEEVKNLKRMRKKYCNARDLQFKDTLGASRAKSTTLDANVCKASVSMNRSFELTNYLITKL